MQRPSGQVAALGLAATGIVLLTYALVRRLTSSPPPGTASQVMQSARNNSQVQSIVQSALGSGSVSSTHCALYCGQDLNFETGVVRCPYGDASEHAISGPFWHPECLNEDGTCPACGFMLRGDERYIVHDTRTVPPKPPETWTDVSAARWSDAYMARQEGMLCYATAASAVWRAFGQAKNQRECAHDWATSSGAQVESNYSRYLAKYRKVEQTMSGPTVQQVQAGMELDSEGRSAIRELTGQFGEPILTGIGVTVKRLTAINFTGADSVRGSIDANKLIMVGDDNHWVVIYGYGTSTRGGQRITYFDPMAGGTRQVTYASFVSGKDEFLIIG